MELRSQEHYELMKSFEQFCKPGRLDKEPKEMWARGIVYQDGNVNAMFLAFRQGYALGQAIERTAA